MLQNGFDLIDCLYIDTLLMNEEGTEKNREENRAYVNDNNINQSFEENKVYT